MGDFPPIKSFPHAVDLFCRSLVIFVRSRFEEFLLLLKQSFLRKPALLHLVCFLLSRLTSKYQQLSFLAHYRYHTFSCSLCSSATATTSCTYSGKPSSLSALSMCSVAIVFLASRSAISLASEDIRVMNSTQHSISRSRASFVKVVPGLTASISVMIFWTVAMHDTMSVHIAR